MADFSTKYPPASPADVLRLVEEYPLAWVVSPGDTIPQATALPLRPVVDASGNITHINGHFAHANPQVEVLRKNPRALLLFMGPHGYVSPSWMADRSQAPSWNYAMVEFEVALRFLDDQETLALMEDIITAMEKGRPKGWVLNEMGPRYEKLVRWVVGFEGKVTACRPRFKLSQDDRDDVYADICRGLAEENPELRSWVIAANPGRKPD